MSILYFAHNGVNHSNAAETASHQTASNPILLIAAATVVALAIHSVVKLLNRRQLQEIKRKEQDRS